MSADSAKTEQQRIIGRWTIGATLGKGGYSWVKRGQDIKTGKIVALKFMEKADQTWVAEQAKQVETEIEALKNIRHQNVMKLYAYNLNAQYPKAKGDGAKDDTHGQSSSNKDGDYIPTILLVLEYAPGGELFDILYYTSALKEVVARTYFKQIISGLEACHNANVVHRDLKPQNLLLDAKYNIKITDFGLSKIIQSDNDHIMKTTYVGTRGYQAPELLLNKAYDLKCDIFSVGVILFILLAGYPPFEQASKNDKWFKPLMKGNIEKFWKAHQRSPIAKIPEAKDLLTQMLCFEPKNRIDMNGIKSHPWFKGETLKQKELISEIRQRHRAAEKKRRLDVRKMKDLEHSINVNKAIEGIDKVQLKDWPAGWDENNGGLWTYIAKPSEEDKEKGAKVLKWYNLFEALQEAIADGRLEKDVGVVGDCQFDYDKPMLKVILTANTPEQQLWEKQKETERAKTPPGRVVIEFEIFRSTYWPKKAQEWKEGKLKEIIDKAAKLNEFPTMNAEELAKGSKDTSDPKKRKILEFIEQCTINEDDVEEKERCNYKIKEQIQEKVQNGTIKTFKNFYVEVAKVLALTLGKKDQKLTAAHIDLENKKKKKDDNKEAKAAYDKAKAFIGKLTSDYQQIENNLYQAEGLQFESNVLDYDDVVDEDDNKDGDDGLAQVLVCRFRKAEGPEKWDLFHNLMNKLLKAKALVNILQGLPEWARKIDDCYGIVQEFADIKADEDDNKQQADDDEYENIIKQDKTLFTEVAVKSN